MTNDIHYAKELLKKRCVGGLRNAEVTSFSKYSMSFLFANESSVDYMNTFSLTGNERLLSVLASGDQIFNFIAKGITEVDSFDINQLSEYVALGLKRAMIIKYNYSRFLEVVKILWHPKSSNEEISDIICSLLSFMDEKHRNFWRELIDYNFKMQKEVPEECKQNIMKLLFFSFSYSDLNCINYLSSEEEYNRLRNNLIKANINFSFCNIIDAEPPFKNSYDLIYLSNILDYAFNSWSDCWDYDKLKEFEKRMLNISNEHATIILHYIFNTNRIWAICNSEVKRLDLKEEEILEFDATPIRAMGNIKDGLMLIRKE